MLKILQLFWTLRALPLYHVTCTYRTIIHWVNLLIFFKNAWSNYSFLTNRKNDYIFKKNNTFPPSLPTHPLKKTNKNKTKHEIYSWLFLWHFYLVWGLLFRTDIGFKKCNHFTSSFIWNPNSNQFTIKPFFDTVQMERGKLVLQFFFPYSTTLHNWSSIREIWVDRLYGPATQNSRRATVLQLIFFSTWRVKGEWHC